MKVRELFRRKLDGAEIIPDPAVSAKLMRTLARREFIRFNPGRFNAYYLSGILVSAVTAIIILSTDRESSVQNLNNTDFQTTIETSVSKPFNLPEGNAVFKEPVDQAIVIKESRAKKIDSIENPMVVNEANKLIIQSEISTITPAGINDSYARNSLINEPSSKSGKLQARSQMGESLFEASVVRGCLPLKIQFSTTKNDYDSCYWTFGDGGISDKWSPEWIFDLEGEYKVLLNIFRDGKLIATSSKVVTVYPRPQARFEITPENAVLPDDEIRFLNYSANGIRFNWSFGDGTSSDLFEPMHRYSRYGNYNVKLLVSTEYGCTDSLIVMNAFSGSEYFINFPNAFIPNSNGPTGGSYTNKSDETSQVFHPVSSGVTDYQLRIFSKLGLLIFESNDVNVGWDGYINGQIANSGVYVWKVRGNFRNGESFVKMGDITLLRN